MAESVVAFVLNPLLTLFYQESARLGGLRQDLTFIRDELESMRAFLKEAEENDILERNHELKQWVKEVREAAYDTDDLIDEFLLLFACRYGSGFYGCVKKFYTSIKTLRARHRLSIQASGIKQRVADIYGRHQRYKSEYGGMGTSIADAADDEMVRDIRQRALLLEESDLVGIQVPKNDILSQILDDNSQLKVVSIVGMGGSAKTTLLRRVYEDASVKRQFQSHAWVAVTQTFNTELILKDLIKQLFHEIKEPVPQEVVESKDVYNLRLFLKDFLRERRYIIVLDDIWRIEAWEALKYALTDCNCGSRVMLTTRIADVAIASCSQFSGYVHGMKALSSDDSWALFCKVSFADKCCPPYLENVSLRILKKCEGLPLAIVSISGLLLLKDKSRLGEWEKVYHSLGGEFEGTGKLDRVKKILLLSYNDLPYYLKCCLLHTSLYPEDEKIASWSSIRQWIGEGFVQERGGVSSVDIGEEYINELVNRNLLQVLETDLDGSVKYYCVHDLVREITLSKAKEHNIITVVKGRRFTKESSNARRLVIDGTSQDDDNILPDCKHLRSLVVLRYDPSMLSSFLKPLCNSSKFLKVLDLYQSLPDNIPSEVFKLLHLKNLKLRDCSKLKVIPKSIKNLPNLEYLDLSETGVRELPAEILLLRKLREIYVYNSDSDYAVFGFRAPNEIGKLSNLEYLFFIEAENRKIVEEVGKLKKLKELGITKVRRDEGKQLCCSLEKLSKLQRLYISSIDENEILDLQYSMSKVPLFLQSLSLEGRLEKVPTWVVSLQGLTELYFDSSRLTEDQLECIQVLPNLLKLSLYRAYEGETMHFKVGGFQRLKVLFLFQTKVLRCVSIEEGAMPHLEELNMSSCELVEELPKGIQNLSHLQRLNLLDMPKKLILELENGNKESENYQKIAHVPEIFIGNWRGDGKWNWLGHYL